MSLRYRVLSKVATQVVVKLAQGGLEKDKGTITGFGLWLNAIKDTPAVVDGIVSGTIWYDSIHAVKSNATEVVIE